MNMPIRTIAALIFTAGLAAGLQLACDKNEEGAQCTDNGGCAEMQACVQNVCTDVECLVSDDCALHNYCDTEQDRYVCTAGCLSDDDCIAGEECHPEYGTCEDYGCRSTNLDCEYGEYCDQESGDCYEATEPHCEVCDGGCLGGNCIPWELTTQCDSSQGDLGCAPGEHCGAWTDDPPVYCEGPMDCPDGQDCDMFLVSHDPCINAQDCPDGADCLYGQCVASLCHEDWCYNSRCLISCEPSAEDPCPRGYQCTDLYGDQSTYVCYGDCAYLTGE